MLDFFKRTLNFPIPMTLNRDGVIMLYFSFRLTENWCKTDLTLRIFIKKMPHSFTLRLIVCALYMRKYNTFTFIKSDKSTGK